MNGRIAMRFFAGVLAVALLAGRAGATDCQDICPGTGDCTVTSGKTIDPGSVVDCEGRNITIDGSYGRLEVTDGSFTLKAHDLEITGANQGRHITAYQTQADVSYGVVIELTGILDVEGRIVASSDWGGGFIKIDAAADVLMPYNGVGGVALETDGTSANAPGGRIDVTSGGSVVIDDTVTATAKSVQNSEAAGGYISITAAGNMTITRRIDVYGRQASAGTIELTALGTVDDDGDPLADPDAVLCTNPYRTGRIQTSGYGTLKAEGGSTNGDGGHIELVAREIVLGALVSAQGGLNASGGESSGGSVVLNAGRCGIQISDDIDVTGGAGGAGLDGGAIVAIAQGVLHDSSGEEIDIGGDVTVDANVLLNTKSDANGGDGGDIMISAAGALNIGSNALLDARGHEPGDGEGATVELSGCDVTLGSGARIDVTTSSACAATMHGWRQRRMCVTRPIRPGPDASPATCRRPSTWRVIRAATTRSRFPIHKPRSI